MEAGDQFYLSILSINSIYLFINHSSVDLSTGFLMESGGKEGKKDGRIPPIHLESGIRGFFSSRVFSGDDDVHDGERGRLRLCFLV